MAEKILLIEDEEKLARMVELELNYEGYSVAEIARTLGRSEGTVKSRLFRARDLLRNQLREEEDGGQIQV